MKTTVDMIKENDIWAGLNNPQLELKDADIAVLGVPFDGGVSFRAGSKDAPRALREISYSIAPTTERFESLKGLKIKDFGDIEEANRDDVFAATRNKISEFVKEGKFFTVIGGDHSITIPVLEGINDVVGESFGIIHIDAHFDLCDALCGDKLSHGSTQRRALELDNVEDIDSLFFIGIRSIEENEHEFMTNNKINVVSARDYSRLGTPEVVKQAKEKLKKFNKIYITLDIDCLDPAYAAGTGTPQFGGLTSRELLDLLEGLFELPIIGMDVVEVAPKLDPSLTSLFAARKIVTESWGHVWRKMNG